MDTQLTLKEKYLLLCYHPEKGRPVSVSTFLSYGFSGAVLLELAELKKIKIEEKSLILIDQKHTGDEVLDLFIDRIAKTERNKKINTWINTLTNSSINRKAKNLVRESLITKRILSKMEATALFFFKYFKYPARNTRPRRSLISDIHSVVNRRQIGSREIMMLIALIGATRMTDSFFIREDRKTARKRIKEILKNNDIAKILDGTVAAIEMAIITSVAASAAITAASASSR